MKIKRREQSPHLLRMATFFIIPLLMMISASAFIVLSEYDGDVSDCLVDDEFDDGILKYKIITESGTAKDVAIIGLVDKTLTNVSIPGTVDRNGTYRVSRIDESAFVRCSNLESVTIPNSVTDIGYCAFMGCSNLASVTIPNSVIGIGDWAFKGCKLTSVIIPNSVISIGIQAFSGCNSLASVTLPDNITICNNAFKGCAELDTVTVTGSPDNSGVLESYFCKSDAAWKFPGMTTTQFKQLIIDSEEPLSLSGMTGCAGGAVMFTDRSVGTSGGEFYSTDGTLIENLNRAGKSFPWSGNRFISDSFTISFDVDGGSKDLNQMFKIGPTVLPTYEGTKNALTFIGWSDGKDVHKAGTSYNVTSTVTFKAMWGSAVTFMDSNNEKLSVQEVLYGSSATAPTETPTKSATSAFTYTFSGWYDAVSGGSKADLMNVTSDMTVYAQFTATPVYHPQPPSPVTYVVTFIDGDEIIDAPSYVYYGGSVEAPNPSHVGFRFTGWSLIQGSILNADLTNVTGNMTVYACYDRAVAVTDEEKLMDETQVSAGWNNMFIGDTVTINAIRDITVTMNGVTTGIHAGSAVDLNITGDMTIASAKGQPFGAGLEPNLIAIVISILAVLTVCGIEIIRRE